MTTWPRHVILLVISTNNILLSLSIAFTYHLVLDSSIFDILNPIHLFLGIGFPTLHCWEAHQLLFYLLRSAPSIILPQFRFLFINILFIGIRSFFIRIRWDSDYSTNSCNWRRPTEQNQSRMALALEKRDSSLKYRCQALRNIRDKAKDA